MRQITILLLCFWANFAIGQQKQSLTLDQAIDYAKQHNTEIQNAKLAIDESRQEVKSVVASGLPQVSVNGNFTHNVQIAAMQMPDFLSPAIYGVLIQEGLLSADKFRAGQPQTVAFGAPSSLTGSVRVNQLVFDGTYLLGLKAAKQYVRVSELMAESSEIAAVENVQKAFYAALMAQENAKLLNSSLVNLDKTLQETTELYNTGFAEKLDVDRLVFAKSNLQTQINNLTTQQDILVYVLKVAMGMPIETELELLGDLISPVVEIGNFNSNVANRIETKIMAQQLVLDSMQIKRYKVGYYPSLTFNASHQQNSFANEAAFKGLGSSWNPGTMYGFNLNIPVFDGFYKKAKMEQAKIQLMQDQNSFQNVQNQLKFQVEQAKMNLEMKSLNLDNQKKNKDLAASIYHTIKIKFDEGIGSSFELISAENDKIRADMAYTQALYELVVAKIELQTALGINK
ncbi:MAG: TolC family protein [Flavobacteriales bacterium]|nr:TolC family protein [Flavobacteriales bacterium]